MRTTATPQPLTVDGRAFPIEVARHPRARRYVLRMTAAGTLRLTVPRGSSIAGGLRFAGRQTTWIAREWRRHETRLSPWEAGTEIWYRGRRTALEVDEGAIRCGDETVRMTKHDADVRETIQRRLRAMATRELPPRAMAMAAERAVHITSVSVRNQRSRWGACSPRGAITLNWRLIQMPPDVADYVILHELAHIKHANHSSRFWREVAAMCSWWDEAERWLRKHGRELL